MGKTSLILGYVGAYWDPITMGYPLGNGYRTYLPDLMRFTAPDDWSPFGSGGLNPYTYCGGDPINHADPSGHSFWGIFGSVVLAAVGVALMVLPGTEAIGAAEEGGAALLLETESADAAIGGAHAVRAAAETVEEEGSVVREDVGVVKGIGESKANMMPSRQAASLEEEIKPSTSANTAEKKEISNKGLKGILKKPTVRFRVPRVTPLRRLLPDESFDLAQESLARAQTNIYAGRVLLDQAAAGNQIALSQSANYLLAAVEDLSPANESLSAIEQEGLEISKVDSLRNIYIGLEDELTRLTNFRIFLG